MSRPLGIDLFSGAGGMSLGFEKAGFDIAASVEIDPIHCATHKYNFPLCTTICASVEKISGDEIRKLAGLENKDIDVVFGGAPCQGFSLIGKRALDDPRNQLVSHYVRLVKELSPKFCVFENVKGLTIGKHAKFLSEIIESLNDAGYEVLTPYKVLNASKFGVPQSRERLFLIAAKKGQELPQYPTELEYSVTVGDAISDLPDADKFFQLKKLDSVETHWTTISNYARVLRGLEKDKDDYGYERKFNVNLLSSSLRTEHTKLSQQRFVATPNGETEPVSRFRKLDFNGLCNTLRAGTDSARGAFTSPRPIHPALPRVITVREAARLHSYPDWFRFHSTKWHGFRQLGNSVPPFLARAVASEIIKKLEVSPSKPKKKLDLGDEWLLTLDMKSAAKLFEVPVDTIAQRTRKEKKEVINE
ncbi:DNA cytosine methyltransferase [Buttiauxella noackiae]|uniref:DNA cytosine methyltransferase n=1 Tax=Buttiauxella noackiae TaxID=82992 RepID=UPI000558859C|nr:DNA cytosine methyltransferase [Buttiauxella noackiae]